MPKCEIHKFYCLRCGRPGIPLARKMGFQREAFHRKKLYCPFCKLEVNHMEIRTYDEEQEFKENFATGVYRDEAESSVAHVRSERLGQIHLG